MGKKIIEVECGNENQFFKNDGKEEKNSQTSEEHDPIIKVKEFKNGERKLEIK